jgi:hypothetical protein
MKQIPMLACACLAICLAAAMPARAQTATPDNPKLDAKACADRERLTLGDTHELQGKETTGSSNPGDKLARTDGVICPPPHLDPDINARAPGGGRTPVIPPSTVEPGTQAK